MSKKGPLLISTYREVLGLDKQLSFSKKSAKEILIAIKAAQEEGYDVQFDKDISMIYTPIGSQSPTKEQNKLKQQVETLSKKKSESVQSQEMPKEKPTSEDLVAEQMEMVMKLLRGDKGTKGIAKECEKLYRKYQEATRKGTEQKKLEAINAFYFKVKQYSDKQTKKYSKEEGTVGMYGSFLRVEKNYSTFDAPRNTAYYSSEARKTNPVLKSIKEASIPQGVMPGVENASRYYFAKVQMDKLATRFKVMKNHPQKQEIGSIGIDRVVFIDRAELASKFFQKLCKDPGLYEFLNGPNSKINCNEFLEMLRQLEGNESSFLRLIYRLNQLKLG